jgi:hypothetical protein
MLEYPQEIDPQNIILVVNSNPGTNTKGQHFSQSITDALDYCDRRGLDPNKILAFNFPNNTRVNVEQANSPTCTTAGPFYGMTILDAMYAAIMAFKADAVIASTYTPKFVEGDTLAPIGFDKVNSIFAQFCALAIPIKAMLAAYPTQPVWGVYTDIVGRGGTRFNNESGIIGQVHSEDTIFSLSNKYNILPKHYTAFTTNTVEERVLNTGVNHISRLAYGRLGCPTSVWEGNENEEVPVVGTGDSVYNTAVTNALKAELEFNKSKPHIMSEYLQYSPHAPASTNKLMLYWAAGAGFTNIYKVGYTTSTQLSSAIEATVTTIPVYNLDAFPAVSLSSPGVAFIGSANQVDGEYITYTGTAAAGASTTIGDLYPDYPDNVYYVEDLVANYITGDSSYTIGQSITGTHIQAGTTVTSVYVRSNGVIDLGLSHPHDVTNATPGLSMDSFGDAFIRIADLSSILPNRLTGVARGKGTPASIYKYARQYLNPPVVPNFVAHAKDSGIFPIMPAKLDKVNQPKADYYAHDFAIPSFDPALPPFFCMCLNVGWNTSPDDTNYHPRLDADLAGRVLPGAWGYTWTSFAFIFGNALLRNGGSAALMSWNEPYAGYLLRAETMLWATAEVGMSLMEAAFTADNGGSYVGALGGGGQGGNVIVVGDPLYRPYGKYKKYTESGGTPNDLISRKFSIRERNKKEKEKHIPVPPPVDNPTVQKFDLTVNDANKLPIPNRSN